MLRFLVAPAGLEPRRAEYRAGQLHAARTVVWQVELLGAENFDPGRFLLTPGGTIQRLPRHVVEHVPAPLGLGDLEKFEVCAVHFSRNTDDPVIDNSLCLPAARCLASYREQVAQTHPGIVALNGPLRDDPSSAGRRNGERVRRGHLTVCFPDEEVSRRSFGVAFRQIRIKSENQVMAASSTALIETVAQAPAIAPLRTLTDRQIAEFSGVFRGRELTRKDRRLSFPVLPRSTPSWTAALSAAGSAKSSGGPGWGDFARRVFALCHWRGEVASMDRLVGYVSTARYWRCARTLRGFSGSAPTGGARAVKRHHRLLEFCAIEIQRVVEVGD